MPPRPPSMFLRSDGVILGNRGWFLPEWATQEIERIASKLHSDHHTYLSAISDAVHQKPSAPFRVVPAGEVFTDTWPTLRIHHSAPDVPVDLSKTDRVRFALQRNEVTDREYTRNRYLQSMTEQALFRRTEDIVGNIPIIDTEGRIALDPDDNDVYHWLDLLADVQCEMLSRHIRFPQDFSSLVRANLPKSILSGGHNPRLTLKPSRTPKRGVVFRYSREGSFGKTPF